jgi:hypothetical protein
MIYLVITLVVVLFGTLTLTSLNAVQDGGLLSPPDL